MNGRRPYSRGRGQNIKDETANPRYRLQDGELENHIYAPGEKRTIYFLEWHNGADQQVDIESEEPYPPSQIRIVHLSLLCRLTYIPT